MSPEASTSPPGGRRRAPAPGSPIPPHVFFTRNLRDSENRAHTREGAQELGFRGSIVGGAIVYGRMLQPVVERFGESWLERSRCDVRFTAPAYDGDRIEARVTIEPEAATGGDPAAGGSVEIHASNEEGVEVIQLRGGLRDELPAPDALARVEPVEWEGERAPGTWDRFVLGRPLRRYRFSVSAAEQREYCAATRDDLALYVEGERPPAHPGLVMAQGSRVVANQLVMPFWIHASSTLDHRRVIRVGDDVEMRCVPIEKWRRGESEWVRFYQVYLVGGEPALEVWKTSVIRVAPRRAQEERE